MKDFLIRSTEDLYVVRGTDRYHVYHGGKATFVLAETNEGRIEDTLIKAQSLVLDCLNVIDPIP